MTWRDAKNDLPPTHKLGSYSPSDYLLCRMYCYDIGRTLNGKWVDMENNPLDDVILWAKMPEIPKQFNKLFDILSE